MLDKETIETRAMQMYDDYNMATGIPWVRRDAVLKDTYRKLAAEELSAERPVVERIMP